jgi:molecular chaperone HscB
MPILIIAVISRKYMEYFELFDLPVSLVVDQKAVTKKYYELSKMYHPDNFSLDDNAKQVQALEMSSKINRAKKILSKPHKRLEYILKEKGVIVAEEKHQLPAVFLGEMMETNEALMELEFDPNPEIKEKIKTDVAEQTEKLFEGIKPFFEDETLKISEENSGLLKEYYYKKKYLARIEEKL